MPLHVCPIVLPIALVGLYESCYMAALKQTLLSGMKVVPQTNPNIFFQHKNMLNSYMYTAHLMLRDIIDFALVILLNFTNVLNSFSKEPHLF